jgi:hypothetical protein
LSGEDGIHLGEHRGRRARAEGEPGAAAVLADVLQRRVHVGRRLGVDRDVVGTGLGERRDLALGLLDHEVHVEDHVEVAQRLDGARAHRQRRHEVPVHDVDVDHARSGGHHLVDLLAQAAEVRRKDRRGDLAGHTSTSMLPPHTLHATFSEPAMRTIVPCSPQCGQTERSSKRCRHDTQR